MFGRLGTLMLILTAYIYLTSTDNDKTLFSKAKRAYYKTYNEIQKSDLKVKVNKPQNKERRFF